ncbi:MAG: 2-C-methyl-D-erythritol 4-phosphate cytidylyltransferase [Pseudomonadota bacterium]
MMTLPGNSPVPGLRPDGGSRVFALIPCAGQGSRAVRGSSETLAKQYQLLQGEPMVAHTVRAFRAAGHLLNGLWIVVSPDDAVFAQAFPSFGDTGENLLRNGGATRAATVLNGLRALVGASGPAGPNDWVLVHDAARCLITPEQIASLVEACRHDDVGGLLAQKLPDTLKAEAGGRASGTVDRSDKWLAQTPQMFRIGALIHAIERAAARGDSVTDESSAIEAMGLCPRLVPGSAQNFKITYPEDFALAEAILRSRAATSHALVTPERTPTP